MEAVGIVWLSYIVPKLVLYIPFIGIIEISCYRNLYSLAAQTLTFRGFVLIWLSVSGSLDMPRIKIWPEKDSPTREVPTGLHML